MNNETEQIYLISTSESQPSAAPQKADEVARANLENVEDFSNVCRTCAAVTEFVMPIFDREGLENNLADKIHKHLPIQVSEQDVLPRVVCYQCASTLLAWHELVQCCVQADVALRTRLAVITDTRTQHEQKTANNEKERNTEKEDATKFDDIEEFVSRAMDPPRYDERTRTCEYCGARYAERAHRDHLLTAHLNLLFHCDECDSFVHRKDFILHMSLHAIQCTRKRARDTTASPAPSAPPTKNDDIKIENGDEDETDNTGARGRSPTSHRSNQTNKSKSPIVFEIPLETQDEEITNRPDETRENEFSDHSDSDNGFGPLPESVFEAIEDSQDERPLDESEVRSLHADDSSSRRSIDRDVEQPPSPPPPPPPPPAPSPPTVVGTNKKKKSRTCPICFKVYAASSSYFYHMKYFHKQSKEHACETCGRKFGTRGSLAQHAATHGGEPRYACSSCGKRFRSKPSLYIHEQSHTGDKRWSCTQCSAAFRWRTHLARHAARHAAERTHMCAACGRAFSVRADLLRHARTHAAGDHRCDKCGAKFAQQRYLKVHMNKKHSVTITDEDLQNVPPATQNT